MDITNGSTLEDGHRVLVSLTTQGVAFIKCEGKRLVIAAMPETEELMIALEGSGCTFLKRYTSINPFVLISDGFQLNAAKRITDLLGNVAEARAATQQPTNRAPTLTDQRS